MKYLGH